MTITPDQADRLKRDATDGPWMLDQQDPDEAPMIMSTRVENGLIIGTYIAECVEEDGDARLIAAAPDMAETIAGMEYEYAAQVKERGEWFYIGLYGPDEPWGPEEDVREYQVRCQIPGARLVRRLVGPVEVAE